MTKKLLSKTEIPPSPLLKKNPKVPTNWDLYRDGVSYSLLSKFIVCRERFRLRTVEGLSPGIRSDALEFGTIFHKALELSASGKTTSQIFTHLHKKAKSKHYDPMLCRISAMMVPYYLNYWKDELSQLKYFESESIFDFEYTCSLNKTVRIRGKRDEGYRKNGAIWLQENKTKGQINEDMIVQTLSNMLQPMTYLLSFQHDHPNENLGGILYNVIRKPQLKQGVKESDNAFLTRISLDIEKQPEHYFKMFEVAIDAHHLKQWELRYFNPLISQLVMWWESIKHNPFDPWVGKDGQPNPHHFLRPFGVYDPMSQGIGEYFLRIVNGTDAGLVRDTECFPELQPD